jgi:hypothetical protein
MRQQTGKPNAGPRSFSALALGPRRCRSLRVHSSVHALVTAVYGLPRGQAGAAAAVLEQLVSQADFRALCTVVAVLPRRCVGFSPCFVHFYARRRVGCPPARRRWRLTRALCVGVVIWQGPAVDRLVLPTRRGRRGLVRASEGRQGRAPQYVGRVRPGVR